jgi:hypothetical protein
MPEIEPWSVASRSLVDQAFVAQLRDVVGK